MLFERYAVKFLCDLAEIFLRRSEWLGVISLGVPSL